MGNIDVFSHAILYICFPVNVQSDLAYAILARNTLYILSSGWAIRSIDVFSHAILYIFSSKWAIRYTDVFSHAKLYIYIPVNDHSDIALVFSHRILCPVPQTFLRQMCHFNCVCVNLGSGQKPSSSLVLACQAEGLRFDSSRGLDKNLSYKR